MNPYIYDRIDLENVNIRPRIRNNVEDRIDEDLAAVEKIIGPAKEEE